MKLVQAGERERREGTEQRCREAHMFKKKKERKSLGDKEGSVTVEAG